MKLLKYVLLILFVSTAGAYAAPKKKAPEAKETDIVIAIVDGKKIHLKELTDIKESVPQLKSIPMNVLFDQLSDNMIDSVVLDNAAAKADIKNSAEYKKLVAELELQVARRLYLEKRLTELKTKDQMQELYKQYLKDNPPQEEVRARHILVLKEADAENIIKQLNAGADFAEIADKKSVDPSGNGGDLGYFTRETMVPEFAQAAFAMKKGEISKKPVKTQFGYHIIKVEDRRMGEPMPFEDIEDRLTAQFNAETAEKIVKGLREKAKIQKFDINGKPLTK